MKSIVIRLASVALLASLVGCVATTPRPQYGYGYNDPYVRSARCQACGTIEEVGQVYVRENSTSGGGAVLGAIIGGVLGNQVGGGRGRTAATVGGAVAGGFAGNAIEGRNQAGDRPAWQFQVRLDDGRWATVTQWDHGDLRPGDRVQIRNDRLVRIR